MHQWSLIRHGTKIWPWLKDQEGYFSNKSWSYFIDSVVPASRSLSSRMTRVHYLMISWDLEMFLWIKILLKLLQTAANSYLCSAGSSVVGSQRHLDRGKHFSISSYSILTCWITGLKIVSNFPFVTSLAIVLLINLVLLYILPWSNFPCIGGSLFLFDLISFLVTFGILWKFY